MLDNWPSGDWRSVRPAAAAAARVAFVIGCQKRTRLQLVWPSSRDTSRHDRLSPSANQNDRIWPKTTTKSTDFNKFHFFPISFCVSIWNSSMFCFVLFLATSGRRCNRKRLVLPIHAIGQVPVRAWKAFNLYGNWVNYDSREPKDYRLTTTKSLQRGQWRESQSQQRNSCRV